MIVTARDIKQAEDIIKYCWRDHTRSFRQGVIEEIATLLAEIRKLKKKAK